MFRQKLFRYGALLAVVIPVIATTPQRMNAGAGYVQHNIVSDIPLLADLTDPNLVNPWGITPPSFWVCDQHTGLSTVYSNSTATGLVAVSAVVVTVPATPGNLTGGRCTGIVDNAGGSATAPIFSPSPSTSSAPVNGNFIFATEDGTISARNGAVAAIKVDNSASGAVYKGLAIMNSATANYIYAANFNSGKIDVYDGTWTAATLSGSFADPQVPAGFAPFNIQNLGGKLYVTYAKQDSAKHDDIAGAGNGFVAVFDTNGNLLTHLISGGPLNSPWGLAIAPASFGTFANDLLVGNFRDGTINAFDPSTGKFAGNLQDSTGTPIINVGLWGLQFGSGGGGGFPNTLYFTAGISAGTGIQSHGLLGSISTTAPPVIAANGIVNNASFAASTNPLAPGSIAAIFGANLTEGITACLAPACSPTFRTDKRLNSTLAGTQVMVNGTPAPVFYASPIQVGFQVPSELTAGTTASVQVVVAGQASAPGTVSISQFAPGIFFGGANVGAVTHADGSAVTASNPAALGDVVSIYGTGLGQTAPAVPTGALPAGTVNTVTSATVTIDGMPAQVQFSGLASCCVGLNQINVMVPTNARVAANVPVIVSVGGQAANTVTIATKAP